MSETKFTPGPWVWDDEVWTVVDFTKRAPWLVNDTKVILSGEMRCKSKADAMLIAAAPDLYAFAAAQLAEMDFRADPAEREKRAELFALLQRARGE